MSKIYTQSAWYNNFNPLPNKVISDNETYAYETYGSELYYVKEYDEKYVWTEVDGDYGTYIVSGFHLVNRLQYFITEKPWEDSYTQVPTWLYRECDNAVDGECKRDCPLCDGESTIDLDVDDVEILQDVFGFKWRIEDE